ncbi:MAG: MFS transporter [Sciscionella sp.]
MSSRIGGLLWQRDFRLLWTGETTSQVGTAVTTVVMPLIAITVLHVGAFAVGALEAAVWLPWLLIGLPAGAWVDRLARRPLMLICDGLSLVLLASVPVAAWLGILSYPQLLVVALLAGACGVFFQTAHEVFLPAVVASGDLPEANAKVQGSEAVARIAGPGLGGLLAQIFGAVTGLLADAVSFVVSASCLLCVRADDPVPDRGHRVSSLLTEIREGLRHAVTDPYLRPLTAYSAASNLTAGALQAIMVVFLVRTVGVGSATVGLLIGVASAGGVIGALLATRVARRFGTARAMLLAEATAMPFMLLIPLTTRGPGLTLFVVGLLVSDAGITVSNVVIGSFKQGYVPRRLLGRVTTSMRFVSYGALPIGALLGGLLAGQFGTRTGVWIACGAQVLCVAILLTGPIRKHRDLPPTAPAPAPAFVD